jgi:hypothetical protein
MGELPFLILATTMALLLSYALAAVLRPEWF